LAEITVVYGLLLMYILPPASHVTHASLHSLNLAMMKAPIFKIVQHGFI